VSIPDFELIDTKGRQWSLQNALSNLPEALLIFVYSKLDVDELKELDSIGNSLKALDVDIVGSS
jgi:hypothetical protein